MLGLLVPAIASLIGKVIDKAVPDAAQAAQLKAAMMDQINKMDLAELQGAVSIILAEAQGTGLKANWRPITMLVFVAIVANNYIVAPYLQAFFGWSVTLALPPDLWALLKIGLGGYIVGRTAEKVAPSIGQAVAKPWRDPDKQ